jgi:hypothetical protein
MIAQVLVSVMLSGTQQAVPAPVTVVAPMPAAKAEQVCRRERITGTNVKKTVCVDRREAERQAADGQAYHDSEREQSATTRGGAAERPR